MKRNVLVSSIASNLPHLYFRTRKKEWHIFFYFESSESFTAYKLHIALRLSIFNNKSYSGNSNILAGCKNCHFSSLRTLAQFICRQIYFIINCWTGLPLSLSILDYSHPFSYWNEFVRVEFPWLDKHSLERPAKEQVKSKAICIGQLSGDYIFKPLDKLYLWITVQYAFYVECLV